MSGIDVVSEESSLLKELVKENNSNKNADAFHIFMAVMTVILVLMGAFLWFNPEMVATHFNSEYAASYTSDTDKLETLNNIKITSGFLMLFSTSFISYLYLVGFNPIKRHEDLVNESQSSLRVNDEYKTILSLLVSIESSFEKGKHDSVLSKNERNEVILGITNAIEKQLNESLLSKIEDKYGSIIYNNQLSDKAEELLNSTIKRLENYSHDLKRKATVNLAYGIGATIGAIAILLFVLMNIQTPDTTSNIEIAFYYTSRLFLVLLVQGIAIFFLNLYKSTLNNVLYISNEITNHESKRDALILSLAQGNDASSSKVFSALSSTERNFVLKKGETSIFDKGGLPMEAPIPATVVADLLKKVSG